MNPVAMTVINPRKEYWPSRGSTQRPPVLKSATLPTELWVSAKEYFAEYWLKELQESMYICTGDISEILLKTALNTIQSIKSLLQEQRSNDNTWESSN